MKFISPADIYAAQSNRHDSNSAKLYIIKKCDPTIRRIAIRVVGFIDEDLIQEGRIGLLQAILRYDHNSSARFETYAFHYVRGSMLKYLRSEAKHKPDRFLDKKVHSELDEHSSERVDDKDESNPDPEERIVNQLQSRELKEKLPDALSYLTLAERRVIEEYLFKGKKLKQIADKLCISCSRVTQLKSRALNKMKTYYGVLGIYEL